jgi:hypothetical protein
MTTKEGFTITYYADSHTVTVTKAVKDSSEFGGELSHALDAIVAAVYGRRRRSTTRATSVGTKFLVRVERIQRHEGHGITMLRDFF